MRALDSWFSFRYRPEDIVSFLLISAVALLPFARLIEFPMATLSFIGILLIISKKICWSDSTIKYFSIAFLIFILPMLIALPDAINLEKSSLTTVGSLRYYFAGIAILSLGGGRPERLGLAVAVILCFWGVDAFWQLSTGYNFIGYEYQPGRANSFFGEGGRLKLGFAIVIFLPLVLLWAHDNLPWPAAILMAAFLFAVVLISGKRTAWVIASIEIVMMLGYFWHTKKIRTKTIMAVFIVMLIAGVGVIQQNTEIKNRGAAVVDALQEWNYETIDYALSKRLVIWETAVKMGEDHWFNGVGPRGFRYAYSGYTDKEDQFSRPRDDGRGANVHHAHQLLLEVWTETGIIGLLGLLVLWSFLATKWVRMDAVQRHSAIAFGVALFAWFFPINSHLAIYSSWSAQLVWMLIALYFSAQVETRQHDR